MLTDSEKAYCRAIVALKNREYSSASGFFRMAENQFADNLKFRILKETNDLLLAVKDEIYELENSRIEIEEILDHGKETEFRR
jgi:2-polyprenyl-3-methyl-5-hydroxy-6-metoxy-1,4-benzoquinol methylase